MGALSSVRIEANPDLFETGLASAECRYSLKRVLTMGRSTCCIMDTFVFFSRLLSLAII